MKKSNFNKFMAVVLAFAVAIPAIIITTGGFTSPETKASAALSTEDRKIADDISNMTGVKVEEIIKLKNQGKTWNEILEMLKNGTQGKEQAGNDARTKLLAESGLDAGYIDKLKGEGFSYEEIMEARLLAERVVFQLKEITSSAEDGAPAQAAAPAIPGEDDKDKEDLSAYSELAGKIDVKTAISLMLKLKKDFGTIEAAFDEYLFSLQADMSLEKYLTDKEGYKKEKAEKSAGMDWQKIITLAKIEEKLLEKIQKDNAKNKGMDTGLKNDALPGMDKPLGDLGSNDVVPKPPMPDVENIKPQNPQQDVMKEINDIKNNSLGIN